MKSKRLYIYIIAVLAMLFWGSSFILTSIVFRYYSPVTTVFLRLLISAILLFAWIWFLGKMEKIKKGDLKLFLLSALFNPFFYFIGESYGLKLTSSSITSAIIATIPLFTPLAAFLVLGEKMSRTNILGLFISFFGVMVMILNKDLSFSASPTGILFLFFAVVSAIVYMIFLKKLSHRYSAYFIIAFQNLLGALYFLPFFLIFDFQEFITVKPDFTLVVSLLSLAIFCSSLAFVFFTISTREIGIGRTNVFSNLIPVFTAIFSFLILSEFFSLHKIFGILLIVFGLYLSQIKSKQLI
ncbi:MAG: DMT family transporter [Chlorobi bacterium]|nr:DMT family transporter [Chlorobiota bacterium]